MNPYVVMGVKKTATRQQIIDAFRSKSKKLHPDNGGSESAFKELNEAKEILLDEDRRLRYDTTGKTRKSPVTEDLIRQNVDQMMIQVVMNFEDDPTQVDVRDKILKTLKKSKHDITDMKYRTQRKIERATRMLESFKTESLFDPVSLSLRNRIRILNDELDQHEDAEEMTEAMIEVFKRYRYEAGPRSEGQHNRGPALLSGRFDFR